MLIYLRNWEDVAILGRKILVIPAQKVDSLVNQVASNILWKLRQIRVQRSKSSITSESNVTVRPAEEDFVMLATAETARARANEKVKAKERFSLARAAYSAALP